MQDWFIFGWYPLSVEAAMELDLDQPGRWEYEAFMIGLFGFGITFCTRVVGPINADG